MSPATIASPCPERALATEEAVDHLTRLYRLAWSLCGSRQLAEQVTEETYVRLRSRPRRARVAGDFPHAARTLRSVLHDHSSPERRRPPALARPGSDPEPAVFAAVADLPEPLRDVLAAVDVAGMSYGEAARLLGIPVGTVMSRLQHARSKLVGAPGAAA